MKAFQSVTSLFCFAALLWCGTTRAATITIGDYSVPFGTASIDIPVTVSGSESLTDQAGIIVVGDGGTVLGNPAVPAVTAVSYTGSIWNGTVGGFTPNTYQLGEIAFTDVSLNVSGQSVIADGLLLTFTLDLTGFPVGSSFPLSMSLPGQQDTQFQESGVGTFTPTFVDGSITINPVPEPCSAQLLLYGLLGFATLAGRRRSTRAAVTFSGSERVRQFPMARKIGGLYNVGN